MRARSPARLTPQPIRGRRMHPRRTPRAGPPGSRVVRVLPARQALPARAALLERRAQVGAPVLVAREGPPARGDPVARGELAARVEPAGVRRPVAVREAEMEVLHWSSAKKTQAVAAAPLGRVGMVLGWRHWLSLCSRPGVGALAPEATSGEASARVICGSARAR